MLGPGKWIKRALIILANRVTIDGVQTFCLSAQNSPPLSSLIETYQRTFSSHPEDNMNTISAVLDRFQSTSNMNITAIDPASGSKVLTDPYISHNKHDLPSTKASSQEHPKSNADLRDAL